MAEKRILKTEDFPPGSTDGISKQRSVAFLFKYSKAKKQSCSNISIQHQLTYTSCKALCMSETYKIST